MKNLQSARLKLIFKNQKFSKELISLLKHNGQYNPGFKISHLGVLIVGNFLQFQDFSEAISKYKINSFEVGFWDYYKDRDFIESIEDMII
mmetsp:Transcript_34084/g.30848  ORF Transcript_34084/g.30848 Transcript_34084/m.30848 type:complete len:90 (-) Transcript_34084:808-1077(-)